MTESAPSACGALVDGGSPCGCVFGGVAKGGPGDLTRLGPFYLGKNTGGLGDDGERAFGVADRCNHGDSPLRGVQGG